MAPSTPYQLLADAVLLLHFGIVLFVVGGLALVIAGNMLNWPWVNSLWFRIAHAMAIGIVVAQAWLDEVCPLTTLESWLRVQAGSPSYSKSFVEHWVERLLFYEAPAWVFTLAYTVFGLLVVAAWWYFPPRYNKHAHETQRIMRTRVFLWYVVGYLVITGVALLVAPSASLRLMLSTADYGEVMPRWVGMMSLALGALIGQTLRHRLEVLYPLGFFMPAAMMIGFIGLYKQSEDPLFLTVMAVVGLGVVLTGTSLLFDVVLKR